MGPPFDLPPDVPFAELLHWFDLHQPAEVRLQDECSRDHPCLKGDLKADPEDHEDDHEPPASEPMLRPVGRSMDSSDLLWRAWERQRRHHPAYLGPTASVLIMPPTPLMAGVSAALKG
jgi:hypothetical protein